MDFNTVLSINQTIHNAGAALFGAGPFYLLLLLYKRKAIDGDLISPADREVEEFFGVSLTIWIVFLVLQGMSGAAFGGLSLIYEGTLPEMAPIAAVSLAVKVTSAAAAFFISVYLKWWVAPRLKAIVTNPSASTGRGAGEIEAFDALCKMRKNLVWVLILLGAAALTGAAFLRWNL